MHHHGARLRAILTKDGVSRDDQEALLAGLQSAAGTAPQLSASEHSLLAYADVLTRTPQGVTSAHIDALRAAGYTDRAIHDACAIISYFAFVNRIADGLGVAVES